MFDRLKKFLAGEFDRDPSFIRLARNILIVVMIATLAILPLFAGITGEEGSRNLRAFYTLAVSLLLELISLAFILRGEILPTKVIVPAGLIMVVLIISLETNGLRNTSMLAMPAILIISAILLGRRSLTVALPLMLAATIYIALKDLQTGNVPAPIGVDSAISAVILILATAGITQLLIARLNESAERARQSEQAQRLENAELLALRASLEERVSSRTAELEAANRVNEKRARQFSAVAQVMSAASSAQYLDELLPLVTRVISEQFNVYHAGIFLLNEQRDVAVLRAANSEGGQRMLARRHSLPVGQTGIVGLSPPQESRASLSTSERIRSISTTPIFPTPVPRSPFPSAMQGRSLERWMCKASNRTRLGPTTPTCYPRLPTRLRWQSTTPASSKRRKRRWRKRKAPWDASPRRPGKSSAPKNLVTVFR